MSDAEVNFAESGTAHNYRVGVVVDMTSRL